MKILLLTPIHWEYLQNKNRLTKGIPYYQTQASWIRAIERLDNNVKVFIYSSSIFPFEKELTELINRNFPDFAGRIRRLIERNFYLNPTTYLRTFFLKNTIKNYSPDIILISGGISNVLPSAFNKNRREKILLLSGVNPLMAATQLEKKLVKQNRIDYVIENDLGYANNWRKIGAKKVIVLPISAADTGIHNLKSKQNNFKKYDVVFVGSITLDRIKKLRNFIGLNFKFWGDIKPGVKIPEDLKMSYGGKAFGSKMIEILSESKIVLNFQPEDMVLGGNMRTFEIPAIGSFMLVDRVDVSWFSSVKPVMFKNIEDAKSKIKYYLKNEKERKKLAKKLHDYVWEFHTYEKHFSDLFNKIS